MRMCYKKVNAKFEALLTLDVLLFPALYLSLKQMDYQIYSQGVKIVLYKNPDKQSALPVMFTFILPINHWLNILTPLTKETSFN